MRRELYQDIDRFIDIKNHSNFSLNLLILRYFFTIGSFRSIFFYRLLNQDLIKKMKYLKFIIIAIRNILCEVIIPDTAQIGFGLFMPHSKCIIIHQSCVIGNNVTILQGVTIGGNIDKKKGNRYSPIIEDNVLLGAGSKVLGPISIGENSMIGANAVVVNDVPKNSVAVGMPAKVIKKVEKSFIEIQKLNKKS